MTTLEEGSYAKVMPNGKIGDALSLPAEWGDDDDEAMEASPSEHRRTERHRHAVRNFERETRRRWVDQAHRPRVGSGPRRRGAGRPRARTVSTRSSARSGDSGDDTDDGEPGEARPLTHRGVVT